MNNTFQLSSKTKHALIIAGLIILALVLIIAVFSVINFFSSDNRYDSYYEDGALNYVSGKYSKAVENLEKALKIKDTEECYLLLAEVYHKGENDIDKAIETLYIGSYKLNSSKINTYLEELKALKTDSGLAPALDTVAIAGQNIARDTASLALSKMSLADNDIQPLSELTKLKNLTLSENNLSSLTPLENLTELTFLHLGGNSVTDLSPLSGLSNLKTLYLDGNPIRDFTPLRALKKLTTLSLVDVEISTDELEALKQALPNCSIHCNNPVEVPVEITMGSVTFMSDVTELDLSGQNISDLTPLMQCKALVRLNLKNNSISDLTPLMDLPELAWLSIWNNKVSDIRPLMGMTKLLYLDADANSIEDITCLANLANLEELWLSYNPLSDITPLTRLPALRQLGLKGCGIDDSELDTLTGITTLLTLALEDNADLSGEKLDEVKAKMPTCSITHSDALYSVTLGGVTYKSDAEEITLYGAASSSLDGLEKFTGLRSIIMLNCGVADISAIKDLTGLTVLEISNESFAPGKRLSDISALSGLTKLQTLNLMSNDVTDISVLSGLTGLREVHLSFNSIGNISALSGLTGITELSLDYCGISDISALASLSSLTYLGVENNNISDITALKGLTNLKMLYIGGNPLTAEQILELQQALPNCLIYTDLDLSLPQEEPEADDTLTEDESSQPSENLSPSPVV